MELLLSAIQNGFSSRDFINAVLGMFDETTARKHINNIFEMGNKAPHKKFSDIITEYAATQSNDEKGLLLGLRTLVIPSNSSASSGVETKLDGRLQEAQIPFNDKARIEAFLKSGFMFKRVVKLGDQVFFVMEKMINLNEPEIFTYEANRIRSPQEIINFRNEMAEKAGVISNRIKPKLIVIVQKKVEDNVPSLIPIYEPATYVSFMKERGREVNVEVEVIDVNDLEVMERTPAGPNTVLDNFLNDVKNKGWVILNRAYQFEPDYEHLGASNVSAEVWKKLAAVQDSNGINSSDFEEMSKDKVLSFLRKQPWLKDNLP